jgi:hypothetical protein
MDGLLLKITLLIALIWFGVIAYLLIVYCQRHKWNLYDSLSASSTHTVSTSDGGSGGGGFKRRTIIKNKYEDYWGEDSEDNSISNFPTRAAAASTLGSGFGYGTGSRSLSLLPISSRKVETKRSAPSHEDYWDENIDFSMHSTDSFGLK